MDVKKLYPNNSMDRAEYIIINISMIPQELITPYNLKDKVHNKYIFSQLTKSVYGLPQADITAHDDLVRHLEPY